MRFLIFSILSIIASLSMASESININFKTLGSGYTPGAITPSEVPAKLILPEGKNLPAVLIVHGSAGPDSRGRFHSKYLSENGYVTMEINMWEPRGVTSIANRPKHPGDTLADIWGAWDYLRNHPKVNKDKIAIMGFSWGGLLSLSAAFGLKPNKPPFTLRNAAFAAHISFYPTCDMWIDNGPGVRLVAANIRSAGPIQIHVGTKDDYESNFDSCQKLKDRFFNLNIDLHTYEGATHGFDTLNTEKRIIYDPVANRYKGADVSIVADEKSRELAKSRVINFLDKFLKQ